MILMYSTYVRERITELRLQKDVSEYKMSYDLGHSKSYVNNITSGKVLPSMNEFFMICDYFSISPEEFFNTGLKNPRLSSAIAAALDGLASEDLELILSLIKRLKRNGGQHRQRGI